MAENFHYPPEVFNLLVDTIPLLCRSKKDVVTFFQGAGVAQEDLAEVAQAVRTNRQAINKYEIVRDVLTKVNARGDSGLRVRREIIKRVAEFDNFDTCWDSDRLKAKGLVSELGKTVNVKDSFTRMKQERDAEREQVIARQRAEQAAAAEKRSKIEDVRKRLFALFGMDDKPQERGKLLEAVLNDLFKAYSIHVREDFRRRDPDSRLDRLQLRAVYDPLRTSPSEFLYRYRQVFPQVQCTRRRDTATAVKEYGLKLQLVEGSTAAMTAALKSAIDRKERIAVTLWEPSWMAQKFDIKWLQDPT